jgi:nitrate reductase beta subunit
MDLTFPTGFLRIDCDDCVMAGTSTCDDCVVAFMCSRDEDGAVLVDATEARALRLLHNGGLVPALRHRTPLAGG